MQPMLYLMAFFFPFLSPPSLAPSLSPSLPPFHPSLPFLPLVSQFMNPPQLKPLPYVLLLYLPGAAKHEKVQHCGWTTWRNRAVDGNGWGEHFTNGKQNPADAFFYLCIILLNRVSWNAIYISLTKNHNLIPKLISKTSRSEYFSFIVIVKIMMYSNSIQVTIFFKINMLQLK